MVHAQNVYTFAVVSQQPFDLFMGQLDAMVQRVLMIARSLSDASKRAQDITANTSASVEEQAQAIATIATDIEQMAQNSERVNHTMRIDKAISARPWV